jgi:hypothetical protein
MALMGKKIYDWNTITIDYDGGMTWKQISAKYGCCQEAIQKAISTGKLTQRARIKPAPRPVRITKEQNSAYCKAHYRKNADRYKNKARKNGLIRAEKCRAIAMQRLSNGCVDCGEADPLVLEFDHRDRKAKLHSISVLCSTSRGNLRLLVAELQKCDVRCANCHRRKTLKESGSWRSKLVLTTGIEPVIPGPQPGGLPLT